MSDYNYNNYNTPSPGPGPQHGGNNGNNRRDGWIEGVSWLVDLIMIAASFPIGLSLTIAHALGFDAVGKLIRLFTKGSKRSAAQASPSTSTYHTPNAAGQTARRQTAQTKAYGQRVEPAQARAQAAPAEEKSEPGVRSPDAGALLKTAAGWIIAAFGLVGAIAWGSSTWSLLTFIAVALGGGTLVLSAFLGKRKAARFRSCLTVSGTKGIVNIAKLSKTLGLEGGAAEKMLSEMIDRGYYGTRAYIDHERGLLVIEPEQMRDVYRAEDEAKARAAESRADAEARASRTVYEEYIEKIRQADIDIADEAMSEKIRRMQAVTGAIFAEVEAHPEKKPQIERFMNYYLPTTLKLLDSYARIEAQGVTGENMAKAKADIERIADTLVAGYEKQLDTLYRAEAVDIAGDVSVIESMMKRDGLAGQNDFRPGRKPAAEPEAGGQVMGGH